jgi:hypothetical protein
VNATIIQSLRKWFTAFCEKKSYKAAPSSTSHGSVMANYYFNLKGAAFVRDRKGTELSDLAAARARATKLACELIERMSGVECDWPSTKIIVTDDKGAEVLIMAVSEAEALART